MGKYREKPRRRITHKRGKTMNQASTLASFGSMGTGVDSFLLELPGGAQTEFESMEPAELNRKPLELGMDHLHQGRGIAAYSDSDEQSSESPTVDQNGSVAKPGDAVFSWDVNFLHQPCTHPEVVTQCQITREKAFMFGSTTYKCYLTNGTRFLMAARKRTKTQRAHYVISSSGTEISRHDRNFVGKVRSDVDGRNFDLFGYNSEGQGTPIKSQLGSVRFSPNTISDSAPRKMLVALPRSTTHGSESAISPNQAEQSVEEWDENVLWLNDRASIWNEAQQSWGLDFKGRVTLGSVKNFQLVSSDDLEGQVYLQFGKVGQDEFTMDFTAPLTPVQAFSICLSSLELSD